MSSILDIIVLLYGRAFRHASNLVFTVDIRAITSEAVDESKWAFNTLSRELLQLPSNIKWLINTPGSLAISKQSMIKVIVKLSKEGDLKRLAFALLVLSVISVIILLYSRCSTPRIVESAPVQVPVPSSTIYTETAAAISNSALEFAISKANELKDPSRSEDRPISNFQAHAKDLRLDLSSLPSYPEGEHYADAQSIYSLVSDEAASTVSKIEQMDRELPLIIKEAKRKPSVLVGWKISVRDRGVGLVTGVVRRWGSTTHFTVHFEDGPTETLALQRGSHKGNVPFVPISKDF